MDEVCARHPKLEDKLETIDKKLDKLDVIEVALVGDVNGKIGLVTRITELEKRDAEKDKEIKELKSFIAKFNNLGWKIAGIAFGALFTGAGSGVAISKVIEVITK